jgi:phosphatidylglycerophosphate synthase
MATTLVMQQALVAFAVIRSGNESPEGLRHSLGVVDLFTLSRGCASGILSGLVAARIRDRAGVGGWLGWLALLYGAIVCDWLDGPIARWLGTSRLGEMFDREADSWLTLCSAGAGVAWGELPAVAVAAPMLRYALLAEALRATSYRSVHGIEPGWVRRLGIVQMMVFIAALAPFGGRATRFAVRVAAPLQAPIQICGLMTLRNRRARP